MKNFNVEFCSHLYSKYKFVLIIITVFTTIIACKSAIYVPTVEHATTSVTLSELQKGRQLYISRCSGCHTLIIPRKYNATEWHKWVEEMEAKAKINPTEKQLIVSYLSQGAKIQ